MRSGAHLKPILEKLIACLAQVALSAVVPQLLTLLTQVLRVVLCLVNLGAVFVALLESLLQQR
jgi:hypothetical protein